MDIGDQREGVESLADVAERFMAEFGDLVPLATVSKVVLQVNVEVTGLVPAHALPAALDWRVRRRLTRISCS